MNMVKGAWCLLAVTFSIAAHDLGVKIDAINKQALSLKERCLSTQEFIDCLATNCCGGVEPVVDECACAPMPIVDGVSTTTAGSYCLQGNVTSIVVSTDNVVIDLNGYLATNVTLADNCVVKNGSINSLTVGTNNYVYNVNVPTIAGDGVGSSVAFVDCLNITSLENVERSVFARCMGFEAASLTVSAGVKEVTLYDSVFPKIHATTSATALEKLVLYKTIIRGIAGYGIQFDTAAALKEFLLYQSAIYESIYFHIEVPNLEKMIIEESLAKEVRLYLMNADPQKIGALFERSAFGDGVSVQLCDGVIIRKCQLGGGLWLIYNHNLKINDVSVTAGVGSTAVTLADSSNILFTDCNVTATSTDQIGFMTAAQTSTNVNFIRCYAQECYNGFNLGYLDSCLVKDCVCDGSLGTSFSLGLENPTICAVGNVALSINGIPSLNYNPSSGSPFDRDSNTIFTASSLSDAENTLERSAWRNLSFELPA